MLQRLLQQGSDLPAFIKALIESQGVVVAGTEAAAFLIEPNNNGDGAQPQGGPPDFKLRAIAHVRPDESAPEVRQKALEAFAEIVRPCVAQGKDGVIEVDGSRKDTVDPQFCLVTLLRSEGNIVGVSAVIARAANMARAQQRLASMELVAGYFEMFTMRRTIEQAKSIASTHQNVLQLATSVATAEGFDSAAMNLCNELASRTGATRVAIGWVEGFPPKVKLRAMSHTEKFDKKQELAVLIVAAMEECLDQEDLVHYDAGPEAAPGDKVTRAAAELSRRQGGMSVLSLPLRRAGEIVGIILMEFNAQRKLPPSAETSLAVAVELLGPQLYDRYQNDRWWITKTGISIRETAKMAIGPKHMLPKICIILGVVGVAFITFFRPMYKVVAPFSFVATERSIKSAPFEGFVSDKVFVEPGDEVKAGQPLMELKTDELKLKYSQALANARSRAMAANKARDEKKQAEAMQALAEAEGYQAEADLYKKQIEDAVIRSPIDGIVFSGDWKDKRHSPVKKGDELFKIGKKDGFWLELTVAERDIQDVKVGATGYLATTSLPNERMPFKVTQIVPLPNAKNNENTFAVRGMPDKLDPKWREGLGGEARVEVEKRSLLWQWTHRFVDWVRLKTWIF